MVDRDFLKSYLRWLETATLQELQERRACIVDRLAELRSRSVRRDAAYLLALLESEILRRPIGGRLDSTGTTAREE